MSYFLTDKEIKSIISKIDKIHHLQVYKTLKSLSFNEKLSKSDYKSFEKDILDIFKKKNLPRLLTEKELDNAVDVIPLTPSTLIEIAEYNNKQIKKKIKSQLSKFKVVVEDDSLEEIKKELVDKFYNSASQAGDSVGVIASMSIGQPLTQGNLNTFHNSGALNRSDEGVKFVERLLNVSASNRKNELTKNIIHFKDKNKTRQEIYDLGKKLRGINIEKLIKKDGKIILTKVPEEDKYWYNNYINIYKPDTDIINNSKIFLRIYLDVYELYTYDILITDVIKIIKKTSKVAGFKQTLECVGSNTFTGIIDIYTSKEFAKKKIQDFSQKISKGSNLSISSIDEQIRIFLNNILSNNFSNMYLKGIQNIKNFEISDEINITKTFKEISIINARDLEKFSNKPYNLSLEDMNYIWYIRITKYYIFYVGLDENKYIKLFEEAGMKIIENKFNDDEPHFIILLPKKRDVKYFDKEKNKSFVRYTELDNGIFHDNKENKDSNFYSPIKLIQEKLEYIIDVMLYNIDEKLKSNLIDDVDIYIEPLYRYAYYFHAIVEGNDIISELYNIKQIDFSLSYPDNINRINELFGIEASRFHLSSKYNSGNDMKKINPSNIDLTVDFQTVYGYICSVTASTLSRQGNSILTSASFQNSLDYIFRGSAFGEVDQIKGISSCIITGSKCRNGTGIVKSKFDTDYLEDENNQLPDDYNSIDEIDMANIVGPCYKTAVEDKFLDENIKQEVINDIPEPPRMEVPKEIDDLLDLENILNNNNNNNNDDNLEIDLDDDDNEDKIYLTLDIPDAPEENYGDEMMF
jgi:hypothetical protein